MRVWLIWVQETDGYTWIEAAWTDDQTAENHDGWDAELDRVKKLAYEENYLMRVQCVTVPGVNALFMAGEATAEAS